MKPRAACDHRPPWEYRHPHHPHHLPQCLKETSAVSILEATGVADQITGIASASAVAIDVIGTIIARVAVALEAPDTANVADRVLMTILVTADVA